jgi:hypothetical protein
VLRIRSRESIQELYEEVARRLVCDLAFCIEQLCNATNIRFRLLHRGKPVHIAPPRKSPDAQLKADFIGGFSV